MSFDDPPEHVPRWATGETIHDAGDPVDSTTHVVRPDAATQAEGFRYQEYPAYQHLNALHRETGDWIEYLAGTHIRRFESPRRAHEILEPGELAWVETPANGVGYLEIDNGDVNRPAYVQGTGPLNHIHSDGRWLLVCADGRLRVYHPETLELLLETSHAAHQAWGTGDSFMAVDSVTSTYAYLYCQGNLTYTESYSYGSSGVETSGVMGPRFLVARTDETYSVYSPVDGMELWSGTYQYPGYDHAIGSDGRIGFFSSVFTKLAFPNLRYDIQTIEAHVSGSESWCIIPGSRLVGYDSDNTQLIKRSILSLQNSETSTLSGDAYLGAMTTDARSIYMLRTQQTTQIEAIEVDTLQPAFIMPDSETGTVTHIHSDGWYLYIGRDTGSGWRVERRYIGARWFVRRAGVDEILLRPLVGGLQPASPLG